MLSTVGIVFGLILLWKVVSVLMFKHYLATMQAPAVTVSTVVVKSRPWESRLDAVANLRALRGVNVTTELAGLVETIQFIPGTQVSKGDVLVQLNAATEIGQLHSLQAELALAKITYERDKAQYAIHAISKQLLDADYWRIKSLQGQVDEQQATVNKKTIRAPFSGVLGINRINPGQYLNPGDAITTLQALNPLYADFFVPQQFLAKLKPGQVVNVVSDAYPKQVFSGTITTIQPLVDVGTRNVEVEATLANPQLTLKPGMFAKASVIIANPQNYLTLPQSAISFNPYGEIAYLVTDSGKQEANKQPFLIAKQVFVTVGETRGDEVVILDGLKEGDTVVSSGQLKLKNGSVVVKGTP